MSQRDVGAVSVVIPHAGNLEYLERCLRSVTREKHAAEVLLVMPDGMPASLAAADAVPGVRCVVTTKPLGYGAAANRGVADATSPLVLVLNDDTWITHGAVDTLVAFMSSDPTAAVCAGPLVFPDGRQQPSVFADVGLLSAVEASLAPLLIGPLRQLRRHPRAAFPRRIKAVHWLSGAAMLVRRSAFDAIGGFDEGFLHGLEDADLCRRLRRAGWKVVAVPGPPVVHAQGGSGYRSSDPDRVSRALMAGLAGWCRYSRRYHGPISRRMQQLALLGFIASRLSYFGLRSKATRSELKPVLAAYRSAGSQLLHDAW